jgi:GTP-binding protein EngB required for normal cell division
MFREQKDDFQDETFRIVGTLIADAIQAQREKNIHRLINNIDCLYIAVHRRVDKIDKKKKEEEKEEDREGFEKRLLDLMKKVYPSGGRELSPAERSTLFMELRSLWKELAGVLDDAGLMFRARSSPETMIRRD